MPKVHEMKDSKFLKKEDVGTGVLATITGCVRKNVAREDALPDEKWCLTFRELPRPLVLNATTIQACEAITGSDDTDAWIGHKVVVYVDPTVSYAGKVVGGIRIRRPKSQPGAAAPPPLPPMRPPAVAAAPVEPDELFEDSVPF